MLVLWRQIGRGRRAIRQRVWSGRSDEEAQRQLQLYRSKHDGFRYFLWKE